MDRRRQTTGPPELRGFSRNMHRDWQAVHAGFTVHWSSGPVEGNINRLKSVSSDDFDRHIGTHVLQWSGDAVVVWHTDVNSVGAQQDGIRGDLYPRVTAVPHARAS